MKIENLPHILFTSITYYFLPWPEFTNFTKNKKVLLVHFLTVLTVCTTIFLGFRGGLDLVSQSTRCLGQWACSGHNGYNPASFRHCLCQQ